MTGGTYVYIALCADKSFYTGITNNLSKREIKHNYGVGSTYTKKRRPIKIIYSEFFKTRADAAKREKQIKGWSKNKKHNLILYGHPKPKKNL